MEYCPLVWNGAAPSHLARLDRVQKRALSLIGPGAVVDSLALRRTISGLCVLFKLMCGARLPCMAELLPPPADYANPADTATTPGRTRSLLPTQADSTFPLAQHHPTIIPQCAHPNLELSTLLSAPGSTLPSLSPIIQVKIVQASTEERLALGYTSIPITLT